MNIGKMLSTISNPNIRKAELNKLSANTKHAIDNALSQKISAQDIIDLLNEYPKTSAGIGGALGGYGINELLNDEENLSEDELLMEILANSK